MSTKRDRLGDRCRPVGAIVERQHLADFLQLLPGEFALRGDRIDLVEPRAVTSEDLRLEFSGELRVAVSLLKLC